MIEYKKGDLLAVTEGVIIHGCNAQGVMASGVAKAVRAKYPRVYETYINTKERNGVLRLGSQSMRRVTDTLTVVNLISQEFYGRDPNIQYVSYGAIHFGFEMLHNTFPVSEVFHFPKIGAGLGNGDWNTISQLIELACPSRNLICWEL